jgi:hypothetical protein
MVIFSHDIQWVNNLFFKGKKIGWFFCHVKPSQMGFAKFKPALGFAMWGLDSI